MATRVTVTTVIKSSTFNLSYYNSYATVISWLHCDDIVKFPTRLWSQCDQFLSHLHLITKWELSISRWRHSGSFFPSRGITKCFIVHSEDYKNLQCVKALSQWESELNELWWMHQMAIKPQDFDVNVWKRAFWNRIN